MIAAVVVTYHPGNLSALLTELTDQCDSVIAVNDGSDPAEVETLRKVCNQAGATLFGLGENLGIAAAQNRGIELAQSRAAESPESNFVLLNDQDPMSAPDIVARLLGATGEDPAIAAIDLLPSRECEDADRLVYADRGWTSECTSRSELGLSRPNIALLIVSGCPIRLPVLASMRGIRGGLFVDHVNLEWGVRARETGWRLAAVPAAKLTHSLGDDVVRLPDRDQPIHVHNLIRNHYTLRNTIALVRTGLLPGKWRVHYCYWATKHATLSAFAASNDETRRKMPRRAITNGFKGRFGLFEE